MEQELITALKATIADKEKIIGLLEKEIQRLNAPAVSFLPSVQTLPYTPPYNPAYPGLTYPPGPGFPYGNVSVSESPNGGSITLTGPGLPLGSIQSGGSGNADSEPFMLKTRLT